MSHRIIFLCHNFEAFWSSFPPWSPEFICLFAKGKFISICQILYGCVFLRYLRSGSIFEISEISTIVEYFLKVQIFRIFRDPGWFFEIYKYFEIPKYFLRSLRSQSIFEIFEIPKYFLRSKSIFWDPIDPINCWVFSYNSEIQNFWDPRVFWDPSDLCIHLYCILILFKVLSSQDFFWWWKTLHNLPEWLLQGDFQIVYSNHLYVSYAI